MQLFCRRHFWHCLLLRRPIRKKILEIRLQQLSSASHSASSESKGGSAKVEQQSFGYDPNLELVSSLCDPVDSADMAGRSPFRLDDMEKKDYMHLFDEQLRFEETNFTAVRNLARRSKAMSMEALIEEWEWHDEIEQSLLAALDKSHQWAVRACLKPSLVRECSHQLVKLTHAILCRGQHAIPMFELDEFLGRVVLLLNQAAFNESIAFGATDNKKKLSDLFDLYIEYFLNPDIARNCSIREWWYSCAAKLDINPNIYPDIELFSVPNEVTIDGRSYSRPSLTSFTIPKKKY